METDVVQNRNPSRQGLEVALLLIAERWQINWINAADYKILGPIEGCAHELAHALDLGPGFELSIWAMDAGEANKHEATALRIEVTALAALGVHLSMRRLRASANWDDSKIPSLTKLHAPLNRHERRCVRRFEALVTHEVKLHRAGDGDKER